MLSAAEIREQSSQNEKLKDENLQKSDKNIFVKFV